MSVIYAMIYHALSEIITISKGVDNIFSDTGAYVPFLTVMTYWLGTTFMRLYGKECDYFVTL